MGGIDPGMGATALVILDVEGPDALPGERWVPRDDGVSVFAHREIRPKPGAIRDLVRRLTSLEDQITEQLRYWMSLSPVDRWYIEDPREQRHGPRRRATDITLGAAFGVCCTAAARYTKASRPTRLVPSDEWVPKTRNRGGRIHPMKHDIARAWLKAKWPALEPLTDHETFAAGVALWGVTDRAIGALY